MSTTPPAAASYLYAVCRPLDAAVLAALPGVYGGPVRAVAGEGAAEGLVAVVETVPAGDFEEEPLHRRLSEITELERLARAHHGVVQAVGSRTPTAPMRLATVCPDDEAVRRVLRQDAGVFERVLARVAGHTEWSVKVYGTVAAEGRAPVRTAPGSGREYLRRRRSARDTADAAREALARDAAALDRRLAALADEVVYLTPHQPPPAEDGARREIALSNAAYLVPDHAVEAFRAAAAAPPGASRAEVTGPWVPYSFATPDLGAAAAPAAGAPSGGPAAPGADPAGTGGGPRGREAPGPDARGRWAPDRPVPGDARPAGGAPP